MAALAKARRISRTSLASSSTSRMAVLLAVIHRLHLRKFDPEPAALPRLRFDAHAPAHALHAFAHDREADAGAGKLVRRVEALEHPEDPLVMLRRDPDAVVLYPYAHTAIPLFGADAHLGRTVGRHELDRIAQQVGEHLR